ncbi:RTA1 like protein-domain-containing protein [Aspergillus coremiiformis]|uniref:RTA1 like protein-domain-containing protein n=1 Tax=Aspergillus coremiiformis TaxID=138285 RepID=A0A5N6YZ29_9EURO|nr:RTA1 like protein-domain-containing protein [Aspergillus coremiiformis]
MAPIKQYPYDPSRVAAVVFAALYGITAVVTTIQYFWWRCWYWLPMLVASLMEAIGYIARSYSAYHEYDEGSFDTQYLLVFLAPTVMAAACYMTMGRIILHACHPRYINKRTLWVTPRFMTPIFVTFDILAIVVQLIGGILSISTTPSSVKLGYNIAKAGLVVQLVSFGLFIVLSMRFHFISRNPTMVTSDPRWKRLLLCLNIACLLIFARSLYRLVEFSEGSDGYLNLHEWNYYVFEAALIVPAVAIFNVCHPARYLPNTSWRQAKPAQSITSEEIDLEMEQRGS